ncbi:hypothetical protein ACFWII_34080 [Streptomyces sp. NPDC127063]|uniref:hypothetical protein n=1 Tax=Streptomyces sp. NPDC127063 TaxID=3347123 RepID=UPI00366663C4
MPPTTEQSHANAEDSTVDRAETEAEGIDPFDNDPAAWPQEADLDRPLHGS